MTEINARFPKKLRALFEPARYKFVRGGRGSGKSWSVARALLIKGTHKTERILCTREIQKSIKQSVHQLLKDQIELLGLGAFYEVLENEIRGKNGTRFYFAGLSDLTAETIKSFEGCTLVWVEEGQTITVRSYRILTPTIRTEGSEIWVTFNPELETDETYQMAVLRPAPGTISIEINYDENPWFPDVLEKERAHAEATLSPSEYAHIWKGKCRPAVEGAIYSDEVAQVEEQGRFARILYDPLLKVHTIWDLGFNDAMAIGMVQRLASEIRVIDYIEDNRRTLESYVAEIEKRPWNWGNDWLPHDGFAKRHQTGRSDEQVLTALGRNVEQTPSIEVEAGIRMARQVFPRVYFNKESEGVRRLMECLKRYRRHISKATNEPGSPLHDEFSHGADMFRYLCINADKLTNQIRKPKPQGISVGSWMG